MVRPAASLSLDLDNYWSYLKTHGNPAWETYPSYLATVVPRALAFLRERGLRGPGFSISEGVLETLIDLGYRYDASTLPTFIGPIARAYYFRASKLDAEERRRREALVGGV